MAPSMAAASPASTRSAAAAAGRGKTAAAAAGRGRPSGGKTAIGAGRGVGLRRHKKVLKDNVNGITKPAIRRLARRGGVKRISAAIYDNIRTVIRQRLMMVLQDVVLMVDLCNRQTVTVSDVVFVLKRLGSPVYGFENLRPTRRIRAGRS